MSTTKLPEQRCKFASPTNQGWGSKVMADVDFYFKTIFSSFKSVLFKFEHLFNPIWHRACLTIVGHNQIFLLGQCILFIWFLIYFARKGHDLIVFARKGWKTTSKAVTALVSRTVSEKSPDPRTRAKGHFDQAMGKENEINSRQAHMFLCT